MRAEKIDDPARALEEIRRVRAAGGTALSDEQTVEFINRKINLGRPCRVAKPKSGPWSRDTQYTLAFERRKALYHRLVRNPASAKVGATVTSGSAHAMREAIKRHASRLPPSVSKRGRATEILLRCAKDTSMKKLPSRTLVQLVLKELDAVV